MDQGVLILTGAPPSTVGWARVAHWSDALANEGWRVHFNPEELGDTLSRGGGVGLLKAAKVVINLLKKNRVEIVIISGNPFGSFLLAPLLRLGKPRLSIILDYRDPWARNPRRAIVTVRNLLSYARDSVTEWVCNKSASKILVVNEYCRLLIIGASARSNTDVIPNGTFIPPALVAIRDINLARVCHFGKVTRDRPVTQLKRCAGLSDMHLVQYGPASSGSLAEFDEVHQRIESTAQLRNAMQAATSFLLATTGHDFEQTTKIYDYLVLRKPIIVTSSKDGLGVSVKNMLGNFGELHKVGPMNPEGSVWIFIPHHYVSTAALTSLTRGHSAQKLFSLLNTL